MVKFLLQFLFIQICLTAFSFTVSAQQKTGNDTPTVTTVSGNSLSGSSSPFNQSFFDVGARLFELGLPDPSNCEYREIEIKTGSVWGSVSKFRIHGWLQPLGGEKTARFAIGWNGVVYPVVTVGGKADLRSDVMFLLALDEKARAKQKVENPGSSYLRLNFFQPNGLSASHESLLPLKALLLQKLGETELAAKLWNSWNSGLSNAANEGAQTKDPFLLLASDWTWALFDAALVAHMNRDDAQALYLARLLGSISGEIELEAEKRGFKRPESIENKTVSYLYFLEPLSALTADLERRARTKNQGGASVEDILRNPAKQKRIAALINKMDEIAARQWGQPGGVSLMEDLTVKALSEQGDEAIEPLLKVLETDTRLTRSVSFHRDFLPARHLISVGEAAFIALTHILKSTNFGKPREFAETLTLQGRMGVAARIRTHLSKYGRGSTGERWYSVLADDQATAEQWRQAAANIVAPVSVYDIPPSWVFTAAPVPAERRTRGITLQGESLRVKNAPSVAELFRRRMLELASRKNEGFPYGFGQASNFALALLAWDGIENRDNLDSIIEFQHRLKAELAEVSRKQPENVPGVRSWLINLYLKRCEAGDETAFTEYADWILKLKPVDTGERTNELFKPLWRYASHPAMAALAIRLFGDGGSAWLPLIDIADRQSFYRAQLLESPLMNVKAFRAAAVSALGDKTVIGFVKHTEIGDLRKFILSGENTFTAVLLGGMNAGSAEVSFSSEDKRAGRPGDLLAVRACDVYAEKISKLEGAPEFDYRWTEAERNRAIFRLKKFLGSRGKVFESAFNRF